MASPVLQVNEGMITGCILETVYGMEVQAFLGIPFAKPPVGNLRFKVPEPVEPWEGTRTCTVDADPCVQIDPITRSRVIGSEDCLYLNIYTKSVETDKAYPVLVHIYGGSFSAGSNSLQRLGPDYLLTEDVVLVTINYRVGMLGFLSLEDPSLDVPGNAGLKDQALALRWIRNNIESFGGDPNNITIMGHSAGSASAHYHILTQASKGLFHKAILLSGVTLNPWAHNKTNVLDIVKLAGHDAKDEKEALEFLQELSAEQIYRLQEKYAAVAESDSIAFAPVIEKPNPTALVTELPYHLLANGRYNQVPLMMGYCNREGLLREYRMAVARRLQKDHVVQPGKAERSIAEKLAGVFKLASDSEIIQDLAAKIEKSYLSGDPEGIILLDTDLHFVSGIVESAELHAKTSSAPVYLYEFSLDTQLNLMKRLGNLENPGACHGDDLGYIFKNVLIPTPEKGSIEDISMRRFVKLITNFVKYSNPTPDGSCLGVTWTPIAGDTLHYLNIGENLTARTEPVQERLQLWRGLLQSLFDSDNSRVS